MKKNQAEDVSEALLEPLQKELQEKRRKSLERNALWERQRQNGALALIGLGLGSALGFFVAGEAFPWGLAGMALGFATSLAYRAAGGFRKKPYRVSYSDKD